VWWIKLGVIIASYVVMTHICNWSNDYQGKIANTAEI